MKFIRICSDIININSIKKISIKNIENPHYKEINTFLSISFVDGSEIDYSFEGQDEDISDTFDSLEDELCQN